MGHAPNWQLAARVVAESELGTTVPELAKKYDRSRECIRKWFLREAEGLKPEAEPAVAEFAAACRKERDALQAEVERRRHEWADVSVSALRNLLGALDEAGKVSREEFAGRKIEKGRIRELAGAVKIVGELNLGKLALFGGSSAPRAHQPAEAAGGAVRDSGPGEVH